MENLLGVFNTVSEAIDAGYAAQKEFVTNFTLEQREQIIGAMRNVALENAEKIGVMTREETNLGRVEDKIAKNQLAAMKTSGTEELKTRAFSSNLGLTIEERGPYGLIGAITPVTNAGPTIINNGIAMIASGNAVVFNVHPSAKKVSAFLVDILNRAIVEAGGPQNLITMVKEPTLDTVQEIAKSPKTKLLVGTGGPGLVKALLQSGKKAIGAGAGNPPVIVDETANIEVAGATLVQAASFDNNLLCIGEKEIFVLDSVADELIEAMKANGAYYLNEEEVQKITDLVLTVDEEEAAKPCTFGMKCEYHTNKKWVGQNASDMLAAIGVEGQDDIRLLIFDADFRNPFVQLEQMMPVTPIVRCSSFEEAIELAVEAEHGNTHSAAIWSNNTGRVTKFGKVINTTIFVQNGATLAGIGYGGTGSFTATIAGPTGEGITSPTSFTRIRRFANSNGGNRIV